VYRDVRNAHRILFGNSEGKMQLLRYRCRRKDNTEIDLKEIGCEDVDWIHVSHDIVVWWVVLNTVMKCQASQNRREFLNQLREHRVLKKHLTLYIRSV
jgi:hypothetical protein